ILPFDSEYIAASDDNFIYKLARSGDVEWKRRLSGRTAGGLVLAGNAVIASVVGDGEVYVIDARSGKIRNRIEIGEGVSAGLSAAMNKRAFVVIHPLGLTLYSQDKCAAK
ncbi:MAG TPA: PQQ-binding-like beta-propeller repeat protein, partial [Pyrinomonadaceae bacterium]